MPFPLASLLVVPGLLAPPAPVPVAPAEVEATVTALAALLEKTYVDPSKGGRIAASLREGLAQGRYRSVAGGADLAQRVTKDLFEVSGDRHMALIAKEDAAPGSLSSAVPRAVAGAEDHFGVHRVEILEGNIGYLDFGAFWRPEEASAALSEALARLASTDALILDLRQNQGGSSDTLALLAGAFLDLGGRPVFEMVRRPPAPPSVFLAEPSLQPAYGTSRPLFVLVSSETFSAGEGLAFLLQERGRATVIGEPTPGAANQTKNHLLNDRFEARVCNATFRSTLTGENWEGTGVLPNDRLPRAMVLSGAHTRAVSALLRTAPAGPRRAQLEGLLRRLMEAPTPH